MERTAVRPEQKNAVTGLVSGLGPGRTQELCLVPRQFIVLGEERLLPSREEFREAHRVRRSAGKDFATSMVDGTRMVMMEGKVSVFLMVGVLMFPVRVVQFKKGRDVECAVGPRMLPIVLDKHWQLRHFRSQQIELNPENDRQTHDLHYHRRQM